MLILNEEFFQRSFEIFNPRNCMYVSRNDGKFNGQVNHQRDTIINGNTLLHLGDNVYTNEEFERVVSIFESKM